MGYLVGDTNTVSIPAKSYGYNYISISQSQAILWGIVTVLVIPVAIFVTGSFICLRRRKK